MNIREWLSKKTVFIGMRGETLATNWYRGFHESRVGGRGGNGSKNLNLATVLVSCSLLKNLWHKEILNLGNNTPTQKKHEFKKGEYNFCD